MWVCLFDQPVSAAMTYIKVKWIHSHPDEPILRYGELDEIGKPEFEAAWAKRKP
jgi:hypothetical protein